MLQKDFNRNERNLGIIWIQIIGTILIFIDEDIIEDQINEGDVITVQEMDHPTLPIKDLHQILKALIEVREVIAIEDHLPHLKI